MSDKSFGDHINRNVVKNSLLSSAVIGLSLEDLTHKAVFLPATPSQGQVTRLDQQQGSQAHTLAHSDHDKPSFPSGDAFSNISLTSTPPNLLSSRLDSEKNVKQSVDRDNATAFQSKASVKSEDDFDMNEYIARLHGTRYVSAPLHSHLKEDTSANLGTEEALEEINLNETRSEPVQQSLTADIAQNFSQLPTVLPHVASAVFSSFSNMLSMKSREQTPEKGYQEQVEPDGVALMGVEDTAPKDFGLPPKEPPISGTSNYRIASKKKYAQIPGLSQGTPMYQNPVTPFTPSQQIPYTSEGIKPDNVTQNMPLFTPAVAAVSRTDDMISDNVDKAQIAVNTGEAKGNTAQIALNAVDGFQGDSRQMLQQNQANVAHDQFAIDNKDITTPRLPIIPPPPMFSNPRTNQGTGKAVLPPSVARRISANQPLIKPTMPPAYTENIFVPTIPDTVPDLQTETNPIIQPHLNVPAPKTLTSSVPLYTPPNNTMPVGAFYSPKPDESGFGSNSTVGSEEPTVEFFTPKTAEATSSVTLGVPSGYSNIQSNQPPCIAAPIGANISSKTVLESNVISQSNASVPHNIPTQPFGTPGNVPFYSTQSDTTPFVPFASPLAPSFPQDQASGTHGASKPLIEPPKATGLNFRMTKKRPQYYSGPIEGVGAISNNVKPVIASALPSVPSESNFPGSFFTPDQNVHTPAQASIPFDINKPVEPVLMEAKPSFDIPQQYNTAFDLSRTTDTYEPKEPKGFGIIGSLKSKLSSLDINKIQSTVTTFFDPAYNVAKGEPALETAPYAQQQYGHLSHEQNNFEVTVPSEQNQYSQFGYQGYSYDQNQYYQGQNAYGYNQDTSSYTSYQGYTEMNTNTQDYATEPQENIPQNVTSISDNAPYTQDVSFYNPNTIQESQVRTESALSYPQAYDKSVVPNVAYESPNIGTHGAIGDVAKTSVNPIGSEGFRNVLDTTPKAANFFDNPQNAQETEPKTYDNKSIDSQSRADDRFDAPLPPAMSFFDGPITSVQEAKIKTKDVVDEMDKMAMAEEIAIAQSPFKGIDLQIGTHERQSSTLPDHNITAIALEKNVHLKKNFVNKDDEADKKSLSLMESLTKDTTPVVAVSSVPLFGLSAVIDKSQDKPIEKVDNICLYEVTEDIKPILEKNTFSLFENTVTDTKNHEETKTLGLSISDVKNVVLFEPPQDNLGVILQRTASSGLQGMPDAESKSVQNLSEDKDDTWNVDASMVTSNDNVNLLFDRKASGFFDHLSQSPFEQTAQKETDATEQASDFNICETCREVNSPELKATDNVTNKLIENMNASIQLSNPVEASFTESSTVCDRALEEEQYNDINRVTENTIETLQGQSAAEQLDTAKNYGWNDEHLTYASIAAIDKELSAPVDQTYNTNPEYTFKIDPNAIGFYGENAMFFDNLPKNVSDEIKAELKTHEDVPRQMSIPSAPPEEDDTKSDETGGLDVLSIEQDAKKDFPLEEEFIIEPSETDDDKMVFRERKKSSEDSAHDTFADRIEKFKSKAGTEFSSSDDIYQKTGIVPPKSMASYFDTGNYAVEAHYKKSLSSPDFEEPTKNIAQEAVANVFKNTDVDESYVTEDAFRLPPGFEDEIRRQFLEINENREPFIPETSTQTRPTVTTTYNVAGNEFYKPVDTIVTNVQYKNIPQVNETEIKPASNLFEAATLERAFGSTNTIIKDHTQAMKTITEPIAQNNLPDPINFFAQEPNDNAESYSRLASYFSLPPAQPDHSKSFFELSQSQNHYRHVSSAQNDNLKSLMYDLTSTQNIKSNDEVVETVNYFSVEYENVGPIPIKDNINYITNYNTKNKQVGSDIEDIDSSIDYPDVSDNYNIHTISTCKYCCNTKLINIKDFKFKTAADSDSRKERDGNMSEKDGSNQTRSVAVNFGHSGMDEDAQDGVAVVHESRSSSEYLPVRHHWFYRVDVEDKSLWRGFSTTDSNTLEQTYLSPDLNEDTLVPTDGGRFDVNIIGRLRIAVYWKEKPTNVRRCSWFYKGTTDARYVPYTETVADKLEEEYRRGVTTGEWHRRLVLPNSELVVMHGPAVMVHFLHGGVDSFSSPPFLLGKRVYRNPPKIRVGRDLRPSVDHLILLVHGAGEYKRDYNIDSTSRPRVVRRGCEESEIEDPEPSSIDHLLLLCHGVGSACDMRFRPVEEVVEDFRSTSLQLLQSHYRNSYDNGVVSRVEVLPISWHAQLHVGEGGVDKRLNKVTLESIPRLRAFTNHTVLDALFYTSPAYHQTIIDTVCFELNRIYNLFKQRNPSFKGGVSLGGHSLGSVILYDLLCHQKPEKPLNSKTSSQKTYLPGTSQPLEKYPQLQFPPAALYALGSPIAIFECIRGVEALGTDFALPTCKNFFNIFHPYDPIAYRIEPLINPLLQGAKPFLIPHHKGRKRMHLELKDTVVRVGADLKQKLIESLRTTWNKWKATPPPDGQLEKVVEEELEKEQLCEETKEEHVNPELGGTETLGALNAGRRVDYVLQEAPLEMINEYLFAMSSHVGYWESEDTMLLMLREIYNSLGVQPDCTVPQQSMTVTRTRMDEATMVNEKECPSTSRGSV